MRTAASLVALAVAASVAVAAWGQPGSERLTFVSPDGGLLVWAEWLETSGPAAVVMWSSWAPGSEQFLESLRGLGEACAARGLALIVVAVQEPLEDARRALSKTTVQWVHDRHGASLKRYRVISIPGLVVLDRRGAVVERLEPTPEAVRRWRAR